MTTTLIERPTQSDAGEAASPRQKLGYLIPEFPGQTHIFFWREMRELRAQGVEPILFSTKRPRQSIQSHRWSADAMADTCYLAELGPRDAIRGTAALIGAFDAELRTAIAQESRSALKDTALCAPLAAKLFRECQARGVTHVHAHSCGRSALICALAKRMFGLDYSITLHGPLGDYGDMQPYKWRRAAFATIITRKIRAETETLLGDNMPDRVLIQAMGVDTDSFRREGTYAPWRAGETARLFACGRLTPGKGHQHLIEAVRILRAQGRDVVAEIAGQDEADGAGYRKDLEAAIEAAGVGDAVTLLGAVDEETVRAKILDAHVFVLASRAEPLGVAYMEAMSCETPVIGTDAGGVPELIDDGVDGVLVPPEQPEPLAHAIAALLDDPERAAAIAAAGRRKVVAEFSAARGARTLREQVFGAAE